MNKDNKKFIVETIFLRESLKHNLSLNEFIVLMYFDNEYDYTFDVKKVSKATCLNEKDVLEAFEKLLTKKLLTINQAKNESGKIVDKISLDNLYNGIKESNKKKEKEDSKEDLFTSFQAGYGHTLSGMDYELINGWLTAGFSDELILGALKEANYNGVTSLRYIDKILFEWRKKGFTNMKQIEDHLKNRDDEEEDASYFDDTVFNYNWLDEE